MTREPMTNRTLRVPDELWKKAGDAADRDGYSLSEIVRSRLRNYVEESELRRIRLIEMHCDTCGAPAMRPPMRTGWRESESRQVDLHIAACDLHYESVMDAIVEKHGHASSAEVWF